MAEAADDDDDAAFFSELLALLEDADASAGVPVDAPAAATPTVSDWPPRLKQTLRQGVGRSGPKELQALRAEAQSLGRTLEQLRGGRPPGELAARQLAHAERRKRQRAEHECQALRETVYRHTQFVRGLDALFYLRPRFSLRLNLCRFLHRHVRLPRDRSSRWGDFDPVSHDARLQSAMDVLCRETAAMSLASSQTPVFHCEPVDDVDCHSVTSTGVYTVDTDDLGAAVRGACVAVRDIVTLCPLGHALVVESDIVDDASVARNILYRVMGVRHRNLDSGAEVLLESHVVTSYKIASDHAVVLWDFVDDDQLHPTPDATNITREITGACLIRRERCDDGAERTVLRSLCTKRYRFHGCDVPERYGCVTEQSMYANEQLFRAIVADQVAAETQLLAHAHAQTQAARRREYAATPAVESGACPCRLG